MTSVERFVSADAVTSLALILLYGAVLFLSCRKLLPRLSPICAWLAGGFLAAQALAIIQALETRPPDNPYWWLWDLNREYNISSTLASIQLAMVGGVALLAAGHARALPAWKRLYLVAIAVIFLLLAWDEYYSLHEVMRHWKRYYAALGIALALATVAVAIRSPRGARFWQVCLLAGLATSGAGALVFEELPSICGDLGLVSLNGCLKIDVWEEAFEFIGVWLALAAMLGCLSDAAPALKLRARLLLCAMPSFWILPLIVIAGLPEFEFQRLARPASVDFDSGLRLRGYHISRGAVAARISLFVAAKRPDYAGVGYSARLVDQASGATIASADKLAEPAPGFWMLPPGASPLYRHGLAVEIPPETPSNRALWISLSVWRAQGGEREPLRILESDLYLLNATQVGLQELVLPGPPLVFATNPLATFENGFSLAPVQLPERAALGETLDIVFTWRADEPGHEDLAQFLRLGHVESGDWQVFYKQPLGARLPTRLWYKGLADRETWKAPLADDFKPGSYAVYTGLYRLSDEERIPVYDADGNPYSDARVPLGLVKIER